MTEAMSLDRAKAEYRLFGRRHAVIDPQSLCDHLDSLVGPVVGEVIMNNLETRLGKGDGARILETYPGASVEDLIKKLEEADVIAGMGITKVEIAGGIIRVEVWNPVVRGEKGAAKAFLFSWWCGALSSILGKELEVKNVQCDEKSNIMRCEITPRQR